MQGCDLPEREVIAGTCWLIKVTAFREAQAWQEITGTLLAA
jgi:hypothetical protein